MSTTSFDIYTTLRQLGAIGYDAKNTPLYIGDTVEWMPDRPNRGKIGKPATGTIIYTKSYFGYKPGTHWRMRKDSNKILITRIGVRKKPADKWDYASVVVFSKLSSLSRIIEAPKV